MHFSGLLVPIRAFQSTLPVRGATSIICSGLSSVTISIHAPREGSDKCDPNAEGIVTISIHAPREGSDKFLVLFQTVHKISIHAPREGSDYQKDENFHISLYFNPRSP